MQNYAILAALLRKRIYFVKKFLRGCRDGVFMGENS